MGTRTKAALTTLAATLLLALGAVGAQANSLEFNEEMFEITWDELTFDVGGFNISCPVQLLGEFHDRQIAKEEELIGIINHGRVFVEECADGTMQLYQESFPWHLTFQGWEGSLPFIEALYMLIVGAAFLVEPDEFELYCEISMDNVDPGVGYALLEGEGATEAFILDEEAEIPVTGGGGLCELAGDAAVAGSGEFTNLSGDQPITVVLI